MPDVNEERFTGKAEIYRKYRSSYPDDLIAYLYSIIGFHKNSVIADIGSGTGIFSRLLLERGSLVHCVEPNDDMRRIAEDDLAGFPNFTSVQATAENTGLPNGSVDFVTVAQAFHWFDRPAFQSECQRILRKGGKVVLIWNIRNYESAVIKDDYLIREKYCVDAKGLGESGGPPKDIAGFFSGQIYAEKTFNNDLLIHRETYIGMNLSRSYSPREDREPDQYRGFVEELNGLFDAYQENGIIRFPQFTRSYSGEVIGG